MGQSNFKDESIQISPVFQGGITASDLLSPQGSVALCVLTPEIGFGDGYLFVLTGCDFYFALAIADGRIVLERNGEAAEVGFVACSPGTPQTITAMWSPTSLELHCGISPKAGQGQLVKTRYTLAPPGLIRFARFKKLLPSTSFPSVEALRSVVHEGLGNIRDDVQSRGTYNPFWDQSYEGRSKKEPSPKKEIDIHPTLNLLFQEWAVLRSIEVIPENQTGAGPMDFCFLGHVEGAGPTSICVEVKLAQAQDLLHGLEVQLPSYVQRKGALYGVYVVLWFRGDWFDKPTLAVIQRVLDSWPVDGGYTADEASSLNLEFALVSKATLDPNLRNIRVFVIDVAKPISASKA
jgi:hypothetical protein